ncbi:hypothetical protein [Amycolatopsis sp. MtRt-6]|uniref:hypothetical protein n=1 Tax=Amycolatopsis sp. MtRt-6 TaxID=2792782 RepID=UPI001A8D52FB|nr:hypothetical protein [Amycolatopsis sp. MtRt-6]
MSSKPLVHRGSRSWWSGRITTLCGLVLEPGEARSPWFWIFTAKCPGCEAVHQLTKGN